VLRDVSLLRGFPVAFVHGRQDLVCRPENAWRASRTLSGSRLIWVDGAEHDPFHPAMARALTRATDRYARAAISARRPDEPAAQAQPDPGGADGRLCRRLLVLEIDAARRGVREEIEAANRVATQVLQRVVWVYAREGVPSLKAFLERLGRVRANELTLLDEAGTVLYRSPPTEYKKGRDAPAWFAALVVRR